jgi:hypothetical protein
MLNNNTIKKIAISFLLIGVTIFVFFVFKAKIDGFVISTNIKTDYLTSGQFGDFIGGVVGTFFGLTGTILIYLTFNEQAKENKRNGFESSFFEMIRLHRENINELRYRKFSSGNDYITYENRQVMRVIFQEFIDCYREVKKFSNSEDALDYMTPKYYEKIKSIISNTNSNIDPIEMVRIDIAYCVVFYGIGDEGESILRKLFLKKYNDKYYYKLLYFLKLKPQKSNQDRFQKWQEARNLQLDQLHLLIEELYQNRKSPESTENLSEAAIAFNMHRPYEKYYGGHQFRLSHYFRHLYQSYNYLNNCSDLSKSEKYAYGKMLRAQLSTYEQALLLVNSISCIGMKWELLPNSLQKNNSEINLITKYNLIKNLPGDHLYGIKYKTYYKNVAYETDEQLL